MVIQYEGNLSYVLAHERRMMFYFKEWYVSKEKLTYRKKDTPGRPSQRHAAICFYLMELMILITNRGASGAS